MATLLGAVAAFPNPCQLIYSQECLAANVLLKDASQGEFCQLLIVVTRGISERPEVRLDGSGSVLCIITNPNRLRYLPIAQSVSLSKLIASASSRQAFLFNDSEFSKKCVLHGLLQMFYSSGLPG